MKNISFCKRCLNVTTRPNIKFDNEGICPPCRYYEEFIQIDWMERKKELDKIVAYGKANNKSGYDCIIGVSGGKDSTRQAFYVKETLGMNPLLVSLNYPPNQLSQRGAFNISNLISNGFDCINVGCSPQIWKNLMRVGFLKFGNWCKSTELALFSSVPRLAVAYQIPLIWWGENAATALGDLGVLGENGGDLNKLKYSNTLAGGDFSWIMEEGLEKRQILQYVYPSDDEMEKANLKIVSLGYFWKDFTIVDNGIFSTLRGLDIRDDKPQDIGEHLGLSMLDEDFVIVNMMIKYYKFGFGRGNDHVNEEIRNGRMTRDEAIEIVDKYDGRCSENLIERFCEYIDISVDTFWNIIDGYVNKSLFQKIAQGKYQRLFRIGQYEN
jgi:N-acetyl sugar amidotransferase